MAKPFSQLKLLSLIPVLTLAGVTLGLRVLVFFHPIPFHGDETEFMAALGFPRPYPVHQPGYPLWVALGTVGNRLGLSPYVSFSAWSVIGSVAGPLAFYALLRRWLPTSLAWWSAMGVGVCPIVWFLSVTALNYTVALAVLIVIIWSAFHAVATRNIGSLRVAACVLAAGLFLRPDLLLWTGPLLWYAAWRVGRRGWPLLAIPLLGLALLVGLNRHLYAEEGAGVLRLSHTISVVLGSSVFRLGPVDGLARNGAKLAAYLGWATGPWLAGWVLAMVGRRLGLARTPADVDPGNVTPGKTAERAEAVGVRTMLLLWCLPLLAFFLLIHMSEAGHVLPLLPAVYLLAARTLHARLSSRRAVRTAAAATLLSAAQFLAYPWSAERTGAWRTVDAKVGYLSAAGLRRIDERGRIHAPGDFWPTDAHRAPPKSD